MHYKGGGVVPRYVGNKLRLRCDTLLLANLELRFKRCGFHVYQRWIRRDLQGLQPTFYFLLRLNLKYYEIYCQTVVFSIAFCIKTKVVSDINDNFLSPFRFAFSSCQTYFLGFPSKINIIFQNSLDCYWPFREAFCGTSLVCGFLADLTVFTARSQQDKTRAWF